MNLAVIPARGGSKRIPRKNIKNFCGKPIIAWSIEAALESRCFDRVIVSTDDEEIADVAKSFGADIPFLRSKKLANDYAGTVPVIADAIRWHQQNEKNPEYVCCIYATAPFVTADILRKGLDRIQKSEAEYVFAATSYAFPIQRAIRINANKRVEMINPEYYNVRSQDLEEAYHDAGQFYWGRRSAWVSEKPVFLATSIPVILPRSQVQDIDTCEDWDSAEKMFRLGSKWRK